MKKLMFLVVSLFSFQFAFAGIEWSDYSDKALMTAQKSGKKVVLGFHKRGCGTCHAQDSALKQAGILKNKNLVFLKVERKNPKHTKVYEKYGFSARQWAAIILLNMNKEIARIKPGITSGAQVKNLVMKAI